MKISFVMAMLGVLALGLFLRLNGALRRPLEHDEIAAANAYSYIGYIDTISQLRAERPRDVKRLAAGLARALIEWRNPNNHMVHSAAISVAVFLLGSSEATTRAAALAGSLAAALLLMVWARRRTGSTLIAAFCGVAIAVHPYFIYYGQTARGYTIAASLVLIQILLLDEAMAGKRGWLRQGLLIVIGFATFLNLTSLLFVWVAPLYLCLIWREATKAEPSDGAGAPAGLVARLRTEEFCWWFFQASAAGSLIVFFGVEHLPSFVKSQGDYGVKFASGPAAIHRVLGVIQYLFPGQWMLVALAGVAGWVCMARSKHWLAGPIAGSIVMTLLYAMATKTVPYDRTFGLWIVLALIGCAWLWSRWRHARWTASAPAIRWLPPIAGGVFLVCALMRPQSMPPGPNYAEPSLEITREIRLAGTAPGAALIIVPFISTEECRMYLPDDPGYLALAAAPSSPLSIYLPCMHLDSVHDGFRCTYYHRSAAEMVYFQLPESWSRSSTWSKDGCSVFRLDSTVSPGAASIAPGVPQIVIWTAANSYFDLDRYVNDRLVKNPDLPELRFVRGYFCPHPTLIFFVNGDAAFVRKALEGLDAACAGSVSVLTPKQG